LGDRLTVKKRLATLLLLSAFAAANLPAQTGGAAGTDTSHWPRWLRDLRRWEIVAFGSFPFTMFFTTIGVDLYRWQAANGMDFSAEGRRYAPWPLTSSGAVPMEDSEQRATILIAVGLSAGIAVADHLIVQSRRRRDIRRAEAIPVGTVIINRMPLVEETGEAPYEAQADHAPAYGEGPAPDTEYAPPP